MSWPARSALKSYSVYGITLASDLDLDKRLLASGDAPDVTLECTMKDPVAERWDDYRVYPKGQEGPVSIHSFDDHLGVRFAKASDFHIWNDRIVCVILDRDCEALIPNQLLGMVLALWLEQRGTLALHASAAVVGGGAAAFLGAKGSGKTSMVAAFVKAGYPMLSEDLLAVEKIEGRYLARPGYPQIRMWPQDATLFGATPDALDLYHPSFTKRWVPIGVNGYGKFCDETRPLRCVYLLDRVEDPKVGVAIAPIKPAESVFLLSAGSFMPDIVSKEQRFRSLVELAGSVPLRRLRYGSVGDRRVDLQTPILHDLATI